MVHVEITNYESIAHAKFDFNGFTTIVGRNTIGKSAVLRAINAALTNKSGTNFIRWGEEFCEVRIKTPHIDILWHKEDGKSYYQIGKEKLTKIGKDAVPPQITNAGLGVIKIEENKINLHYAEQYNPLFLVDKQTNKTADLLLSIYGLDKIYKAIDLCNKEQRNNISLLKTRREDLACVTQDIKKFSGYEELSNKKDSLLNKKSEIDNQALEIETINKYVQTYIELAFGCKRLKPVHDVSIPSIKPILAIYSECLKLKDITDKFLKITTDVKRFIEIKNVVIKTSTSESIDKEIKDINNLKNNLKTYDILTAEVSKLKAINSLELPGTPSVDFKDIEELKNKREYIIKTHTETKDLEIEISKCEILIKKCKEDKKSYEICPACGSTL